MSALNLLLEYSSDSENDEVPTKADEHKSSTKLPLPESISKWKGITHHEQVISDPSEHQGRVRSFEHERGNWATLTYIKYVPSSALLSWMENIKYHVDIDEITLHEEFHISLTRTLILKYHWIDSFVESVKKLCMNTQKFNVKIMDLQVYCNDNETRTFLSFRCFDKQDSLNYLTKKLDHLLAEYKLPPYYENASYHISFMWCLGNKRKYLEKFVPDLTYSFDKLLEEHFVERNIFVDKIHCKIGNRTYVFSLQE